MPPCPALPHHGGLPTGQPCADCSGMAHLYCCTQLPLNASNQVGSTAALLAVSRLVSKHKACQHVRCKNLNAVPMQAMQTANSRLRQMLTAMVAVKQTSKHHCHQPRPGKSPRAVLTSPGHVGRSTCCQRSCTAGHDRYLGRSQKRFISQVKTRHAAQDTYVKPRSSR